MDDKTRTIILAFSLLAIIGAIIFLKNPFEQQQTTLPEQNGNGQQNIEAPSPYPTAPEIIGVYDWINSKGLKIADLRGKVVLVDFWTYSCINCIRTLPHLKEWHEKYKDLGFVLIGVHSPEFAFEKKLKNVQNAVDEFGLTYPVALDNDMQTWRNYKNRFWPAKYLIDADGKIRYTHFGEGAYEETEKQIQALLEEKMKKEVNIEISEVQEQKNTAGFFRTRELYAGYNFGNYIGNAQIVLPEQENEFTDPTEHEDGKIYLQGKWFNSGEFVQHARKTNELEDYVAIKFFAAEANIVSNAGTNPYKIFVTLNGKPLEESSAGKDLLFDEKGNSFIEVTENKLYNVFAGKLGIYELKLASDSDEFSLYTFTFGG